MKTRAFLLGAAAGIVCVLGIASTSQSSVFVGDTGPDGGSTDGSVDSGGFETSLETGCSPSAMQVCGDDGGTGCAGNPGSGGTGGQGGGASIALYMSGNSHVTMSGGAFFIGPGGQGGNGGNGGAGAPGDAGLNGASKACPSGCDINCNPNPGSVEGGVGGNGGTGGAGGRGGGGAGGPAYCYVNVNGAPAPTLVTQSFTISKSVCIGPGGLGGQPNGPNAPDGGLSYP